MAENWTKELIESGACREAVEWAQQFGSPEEAWQKCERGDWMLWLAGRWSGSCDSDSRKKVLLATCQCARLALPYVKKDEDRPLKAIELEAWAESDTNISISDLRKAYAAAAATYAAAAATYAAAYAYARIKTLKECADIVRRYYPEPPKKEL